MTDVFSERVDAPSEVEVAVAPLLDLIGDINAGASLETAFALVARALRQLFKIDRFAIVLVQEDGSLRLTSSEGLSRAYLNQVVAHIDEGAGSRALSRRRPLYLRDAPESAEFAPLQDAARNEGFHTVLIWPLYTGARPIGYLIMYHDEVREYTPAEIVLAHAMAQQAAVAVQHNRLLEEAEGYRTELERRFRQRAAEVEAIDEIILRISSSLDLESTLQSIVDAAATLSGSVTASLYLQDGDVYRAVAAYGLTLEELQRVVLEPSIGLMAEMCRTGEPVQASNFAEQVKSTPEAYEAVHRTHVKATLGVPLMQAGVCVGALYVGALRPDRFSTEAVHVLQRLASFAQVAVQNAQRFSSVQAERSRLELEQERSRSRLMSQMLDLSVLLNSDLSKQVLIERVVEAAMGLVGASAGTLGLVEGDQLVFRRYYLPAGWTDFSVILRPGEGIPGYVWETRKPYISNDCENDPHVVHTIQERMAFHQLAYVPIFNRAGDVIGTLGVYDPVSDRRFAQEDVEVLRMLAHQAAIAIENAQLNGMRDAFLSIVSHELKTPVTSIKGFAQVLKRRLSQESIEQGGRYLDVINAQADRLTALINDLLDLSRIQTGRFVFHLQPLDYSALVGEVLTELRLVSSPNPIRLTAPEHVFVQGNEGRLRQVLVNVVDNALKHGPRGGAVDVEIEVGEEVTTRIRDEGPGLPAAEAERIFTPYYQVNQASDRYSKGLGLGLFISRQIITEHGGRIWLETGERTTFVFTLPRAASDTSVS